MKNITIILLLFLSAIVFGQSETKTVDITGYSLSPNNEDLKFLDKELARVQLVGLGESTHGTKEFNHLYLKMFKYLVEEHNFNTLFLEDEFVFCSKLDDYVKGGENADSVSVSILRNWPWRTKEMNDLIGWIRDYNMAHPAKQLSIVGMDVQEAKSMCQGLNDILLASHLEQIPLPNFDRASTDSEMNDNNQQYCSPTLIEAYTSKLEKVDEKYKEKYARLLEYLNWSNYMSYNPKRYHLRDLGMGKIMLSYLEKKPETKAMIIAHNTHLLKYNRGKKKELKNNVLAGGVLDKALGDKYYFILQDFDGGCYNVYHRTKAGDDNDINNFELSPVCIEESTEKSIGSFLRNKDKIISFISRNDLAKMVGTKHMKYHNIGALHRPDKKNPNQTFDFWYTEWNHFDACLFHQISTATTLLKKKDQPKP